MGRGGGVGWTGSEVECSGVGWKWGGVQTVTMKCNQSEGCEVESVSGVESRVESVTYQ